MAVNGKAWAHGSATHAAKVIRNSVAAMFGLPVASHANALVATTRLGGYGVVGQGDMLVTSTGGLGYSIAVGRVVVAGTSTISQGAYTGYNDGAVTGTLTANSAFIRHDLVCYRVRDTDEDASGSEDDLFHIIQGISASTDPAVPSSLGSLVVLARATVPATSGAATFTDLRSWASAIGGTVLCTSAGRPSGARLREGDRIYEIDTNREWKNTSTTTTANWVPVSGRYSFYGTASGTLGSGFTNLVWSEVEDADGFYPGSGSSVTVPAGLGGKYVCSAQVGLPVALAAGGGNYDIFKNGTTLMARNSMVIGSYGTSITATVALAAGDFVIVQIGLPASHHVDAQLDITRVCE